MPRPVSNPMAVYLTPPARLALDQTANRYIRAALIGFLGFLCREGLTLADVRQEHLQAYAAAAKAMGLSRPKQRARDAAMAWNKVAGLPGWPKRTLVPPSSTRSSIRYQDLPADFRNDADTYFGARSAYSDEDLFDSDAVKPLAAATLKDRKGKLCQLVVHFVEAGGELKHLRSLADLVVEPAAKKILGHIWTKAGKQPNAHASNLARFLRLIAQHHCGAPEPLIRMIRSAEGKMTPAPEGMTKKNRARLRTILEDAALNRLLTLPSSFMASVDRDRPTLTDAVKVQSALAMQIELEAPMRAKNLAALDMERHFDFVSDTQCHIIIEAGDVKNAVTLDYVLGARFIKLYRLYVDIYRPLLLGEEKSSALFISRTGRTKNPAELAAQLQSFIKDGTGLRMNVHLFRHLTGYLFLRHYPGQYEPVRQLLGHRSVKTTVSFYVGLEEDESFKRYGAVLDELIERGAPQG